MKTAFLQQESKSTKQDLDKNTLLVKLEKSRKQELETIIMCQEKEEQIISAGAKLVLSQIRMNSAKHAHILQVLIDLHKEDMSEYLWDHRLYRYVSQGTTKYAVQRDFKVEKNLLQTYQDVIARIDDLGIKMLLHYVIEDAIRHHMLLREVVERLSKLDTS